MADWNTPTITTEYDTLLSNLKSRDLDAATQFATLPTNPVTDMVRFNRTNSRWEEYDGASWVAMDTSYEINVTNLGGQAASYYTNAGNLNAGTLPAARFNDTSHGNRGGGSLHALASGSAHGFMSSTDFSKLVGIEAGATADQSAAEILAALITVDGPGSGLNADLLDGNQASAFATSGHTHTSFADLNITGTFTSRGIDDNATTEVMQLADNLITLRQTTAILDTGLTVGVADTTAGTIGAYGAAANQGGTLQLWNSGDYDTTNESFRFYTYDGNLRIGPHTGYFAQFTEAGAATFTNNMLVEGTLTSLGKATLASDVDITGDLLRIGSNDTDAGTLTLFGDASRQGGLIQIHNAGDQDATNESWRVYSYDGQLRIGPVGAIHFRIAEAGTVTVSNGLTVNGTLTATSPTLNTSISGTAVLDEDDMASDSATQIATQQSIKKYVDDQIAANSAITAWVNFTGTGTITINGSDNVSSITDNGTGRYTVNFTSTMSNANYATSVTPASAVTGNNCYGYIYNAAGITTSSVVVATGTTASSVVDAARVNVIITGGV